MSEFRGTPHFTTDAILEPSHDESALSTNEMRSQLIPESGDSLQPHHSRGSTRMWTGNLGVLKLFLVLVLSLVAFDGAAATKPNILVLLTEDEGYGDVFSYGPSDVRTSNIDRTGAAGMLFTTKAAATSSHSDSPTCSNPIASKRTPHPARASETAHSIAPSAYPTAAGWRTRTRTTVVSGIGAVVAVQTNAGPNSKPTRVTTTVVAPRNTPSTTKRPPQTNWPPAPQNTAQRYGWMVTWLCEMQPLGKLHSKFRRALLENLVRKPARRMGSP